MKRISVGDSPMDIIPSETIYSYNNLVIPMADAQHIEKKTLNGEPNGLWLITKHTHWDMEADTWSNPIYVPQEDAERFLKAWCYFRYEVDGIKKQMK